MPRARDLAVRAAAAAAFALLAARLPAQTGETHVEMGGGKLKLGHLTELHATVTAIDLARREVTLRGPKGNSIDVVVGEDVKNLPQVRVGDEVVVQAYESLALSLHEVDGSPAASESSQTVRAEPGALPGKIEMRQHSVIAKVTEIDTKNSIVTLTGPEGNLIDVEVPAEAVAKVKVGDMVEATYQEALAISVSRVEVN